MSNALTAATAQFAAIHDPLERLTAVSAQMATLQEEIVELGKARTEIFKLLAKTMSVDALADAAGITRARVWQILNRPTKEGT